MKRFFLMALFVALAFPAMAQESGGKDEHEGCKAKVEALCPGVQPGGGRLRDCLKQQGKTLADVCPEAAAKMKEKKAQSGDEGQQGGTQAPVAQSPGSDTQ